MITNFANSQISGQDLDPDLNHMSHTGFCSCGIFRSPYLKYVYEVSSAVICMSFNPDEE